MKSALIAALLLSLSACIIYKGHPITQTQTTLTAQLLDHFDTTNTATWTQRYFVFDQFYQKGGPVFLYICGEGPCDGISSDHDYLVHLCEKYGAMTLSLEHRFYGQSQPFGQNEHSYSTSNLRYLTVEQGMRDMAYLINYIKQNALHGVDSSNPWMTVGGSYAGAVSAWFRYNYPHLTIGAIASSAVVHAIEDFQRYDYQIGQSTSIFSSFCSQSLHDLTNEIQSQILGKITYQLAEQGQNNYNMKARFQATSLSDEEFLMFISDFPAGYVQYGQAGKLCDALKGKTIDQQINWYVDEEAANDFEDIPTYTVQFSQNETYDEQSAGRQWLYQTCTEFGWFQTAWSTYSFRPSTVTLQTYRKLCTDVFGDGFIPRTDFTNLYLGSTSQETTNIVFINGSQDPWQWASITQDQGSIKAFVAQCDTCGHCCDLYAPKDSDAPTLKEVRRQVEINIESWLSEYQSNLMIKNKFENLKKVRFAQ